jgi:hypothetical protein
VGVLRDFGELALQLDAAGGVARQLEGLGDHGHDFAGVKAGLLRRHRLGKGAGGEDVHLFAGDAVLLGQVLGGLDHVMPAAGSFSASHMKSLNSTGAPSLKPVRWVKAAIGLRVMDSAP